MIETTQQIDTRLDELDLVQKLKDAHKRLLQEATKVVYGQEETLDFMLISMLCKGHVLLLGLPGLGKTLMANTLAQMLSLDFFFF